MVGIANDAHKKRTHFVYISDHVVIFAVNGTEIPGYFFFFKECGVFSDRNRLKFTHNIEIFEIINFPKNRVSVCEYLINDLYKKYTATNKNNVE